MFAPSGLGGPEGLVLVGALSFTALGLRWMGYNASALSILCLTILVAIAHVLTAILHYRGRSRRKHVNCDKPKDHNI